MIKHTGAVSSDAVHSARSALEFGVGEQKRSLLVGKPATRCNEKKKNNIQ